MSEAESKYVQLWKTGVVSFDLFQFHEVPYKQLLQAFGEPATESDIYDYSPGPAKYWYLKYPCGLKVVLQFYDCGTLVVYADKAEYTHVKRHLGLKIDKDNEWSTQSHFEKEIIQSKNYLPESFMPLPPWLVERTDDNANTFIVEAGISERAAKCLAATLEATGHKQLYIARPQA